MTHLGPRGHPATSWHFRRILAAGAAAVGLAGAFGAPAGRAQTPASPAGTRGWTARISALEHDRGGRIGVAVLRVGRPGRLDYRADETFPLCSTFKVLLAAAVLDRANPAEGGLNRPVALRTADLVANSPVTAAHLREGAMTLGALCAAAIESSDNTAANLLLAVQGGPAGLNRFLRRLGDGVTHLDRIEPALNAAEPGDRRDTTTPSAFAQDLNRLLFGPGLSAAGQRALAAWMVACQTGAHRLRVGAPPGWIVGDKTGSSANGATHDVAVFWPPHGSALIVCVFYVGSSRPAAERDAVLAEVGRLSLAALERRSSRSGPLG